MVNHFLYAATVLIWGTTWIGIKFQLGVVPPELSVAYRFYLASVVLILYSLLRKKKLRFHLREYAWIAFQGSLLFSLTYICQYYATEYLTTGLVAVVASTIVMMNVLNGAWLFGHKIQPPVVIGAIFGLLGITLVFFEDFLAVSLESQSLKGFAWAFLGFLIASYGQMISVRNQRNGIPVLQTNAYGMFFGATLMLMIAWIKGNDFVFDPSPLYVGSLLYLAIFGSVIAFGSYLTLLGRIGADRASYSFVLFPIIALAISTFYEAYSWSLSSGAGVVLILLGNVIVLSRFRRSKKAKTIPVRS